MKLGILIHSMSGGGAERVVSYLLKYCVDNDINVHLILMNSFVGYELPKEVQIHYLEDLKTQESGALKALKIPLLAYKYAKLIKKLELSHSISFLTRPSFINILARKFTRYKYKLIINERAFPSLQYGYKSFQSTFNKKMIKSLYKKSDLVICNSHGNAEDLVANFDVPKHKMQVIHNPIDLKKINNVIPNESIYDNTKFNMVTLGRLDIGKNHTMLIEALHSLKNKDLRLYIFGSGSMKESLEQLIEKLNVKDQVFLMGFDSNPSQYLKTADLFVFGSNHEGFPNVLLEAMASKLPILSTNCQSGPSEIMQLKAPKNDLMITDYGILVPIKDTQSMAKGMQYFIDHQNYTKECAKNVQQRVKYFEKNSILDEYMSNIKQ